MKINISNEELQKLINENTSLKNVLDILNIEHTKHIFTYFRRYLQRNGINYTNMPLNERACAPKYNEKDLRNAVNTSTSISETLIKLNVKPITSSRRWFHNRIEFFNIDISHFKAVNVNYEKLRKFNLHNKVSLESVMTENSTFTRHSLKRRLYSEGYKQKICEICGQTEDWNGLKLVHILDHINGINNDNRLENLRIVCPNCNSQLSTNCGRNIKKV